MSEHQSIPRESDKEHSDQSQPSETNAGTDNILAPASEDHGQHGQNKNGEQVERAKRAGSSLLRRIDAHTGAITGLATVGILGATVAYALVSSSQLATMRSQLSAMKEQTASANSVFMATERPWVALGRPPNINTLQTFEAYALVRNDVTGRFEWPVTFYPINVGRSPAMNVNIRTKFLAIPDGATDAASRFAREFESVCNEAPINAPFGIVIFPGETRGPEPGLITIPAPFVAGCRLYAMVCITYESTIDTLRHRTQFGFSVIDARGPLTSQTTSVAFADLRVSLPTEFQSSAAE